MPLLKIVFIDLSQEAGKKTQISLALACDYFVSSEKWFGVNPVRQINS